MKTYPMTHRTLSHSITSNDGSQQYAINYSNLEGFQTETVERVLDLTTEVNKIANKLAELDAVLTWVGTHRPEAIIDYTTTHAVINRLEDSNDEMMEKSA